MFDAYFPPFRQQPTDPGLNNVVGIRAHYYAFYKSTVGVSLSVFGDKESPRAAVKVLVVEFDEAPEKISATTRKNWQILTQEGTAIIPESVSMISERAVAIAVPSLQVNEIYTILYAVYDTSGNLVSGSIEARGI